MSSKKGMVNFTFTVDHGTHKKDEVVKMHSTTAEALVAHKIGKMGEILKGKVVKTKD